MEITTEGNWGRLRLTVARKQEATVNRNQFQIYLPPE
jgi:hypothetical protein